MLVACMHKGTLPPLPGADDPLPEYRRDPSRPQHALLARSAWTRRTFLVLGLGLTTGAGYLLGRRAANRPGEASASEPPAARGSLLWALAMQGAPAADLLAAAGDLERVSLRHRSAVELVPVFVRILELVLTSTRPEADAAGACAVRSLVRLGRLDRANAFESELARHAELAQTRVELADAMVAARRRPSAPESRK